MTRDEQALITEFVTRAANGEPGQPQPPIDPEADAIIRALFVRNPNAAYRITLLAIAQARALQAIQAHGTPQRQGFWQRLFGGPQPGYGQPYGGGMPGGFGSSIGQGLALGAGVALGEDLVRDVTNLFDGNRFDQNAYDQGAFDQANYDQSGFDGPNNDFI